MKKIGFLLCIFNFITTIILAQSDSSSYQNLKIVKIYPRTDRHDALKNCHPCLAEYYDDRHNIKSRVVLFDDCAVGKFIDYYPNGQAKLRGSFRENHTGNWNDIWKRNYCATPDGKWTYYNKNGSIDYEEFWNNGLFLKQVPQQSVAEISDIALMLDTNRIDTFRQNVKISLNDIQDISAIPLFKNDNQDSDISMKLRASIRRGNHVLNTFQQKFNSQTITNLNLHQFLKENRTSGTTLFIQLSIFNEGKTIDYFDLILVE